MLCYTRREKHKQAKLGVPKDKLSNLPDAILTHILSFLSTKNAVRTGVLSHRWKSLWIGVPDIDLTYDEFRLRTECYGKDKENINSRYLKFANRVLTNPNVPMLRKLSISCKEIQPCHIQLWICAAIKRKVHRLHIRFGFESFRALELAQSLFSCNTLVVLKLSGDIVLNFPMTSTSFPHLKVLKLSEVSFKDDSSAQNLFSSCPVLEELVIARTILDNLESLNVISQSLKKLLVKISVDYHEDFPKMLIDAPALEILDIDDNMTQDYVVRNLSSICRVCLHVSDFFCVYQNSADFAICLFELLQGISNVTSLSLSSSTMQCLSAADSYSLPVFHNLTCLKFFNKDYSDWNWKLVLDFLKNCPLLEVLIFEGFSFSRVYGESWFEWYVPDSLTTHLKTLEIKAAITNNGVEQLRYFVENANALEKTIIKMEGDSYAEKSCLPKCSKPYQIEII